MNKNIVCILGATGMLGSQLSKYLSENSNYDLFLVGKNKDKLNELVNQLKVEKGRVIVPLKFDVLNNSQRVLMDIEKRYGYNNTIYWINCLGMTNRFDTLENKTKMYKVNSIFPQVFSQKVKHFMQISTDCVFKGDLPIFLNYDEELNEPNSITDYGISKYLGENKQTQMILRTSIIGEEMFGEKRYLVEWVKEQTGKEIELWVNNWWSGVTTKELSRLIHKIIEEKYYKVGLNHISLPYAVRKSYVVKLLLNKFNIKPSSTKEMVGKILNRSLKQGDLIRNLIIKSIEEQIKEM